MKPLSAVFYTPADNLVLVCEPEVKPLRSFILGRLQVIQFLFRSQSIPNLSPLLVPPHIVELSKEVRENVQHTNANKHAISAAI